MGAGGADGVTVETGGRDTAVEHHTGIRRLYDAVFLRPPFFFADDASADHEAGLVQLREEPAFCAAVALANGRLVGFCYGTGLPPDHRWWTRFDAPLPEETVREWPGRTFAVIDLAVDRHFRRSGVARRLVEALLGTRSEQRAVLSVQPTARAAHAFYTATGWRLVGRKGPIPGVVPPYWDIYLKDLRR